ncbi:MAG TPA: aldose 1-epimerase family protein [Candidatus Sulfomarinibacteraceae bacterium]|nr:aldose 1-epimerase family protein [Candidatus Sulfomarinibacteraceae bacterium]
MPTLYGRRYSVEELRRRVGRMSQLAGIRASTLNDGMAQGVRVLDFHTGSGLRFSVLPDRGMDLGAAEWRGVPLVWHSPTGPIHPAYYEQEGLGWLRGFYGGLMVTCGFMNVAVASEDEGFFYGMHGRASYIPAGNVSYEAQWEGDRYVLRARGQVRETRVFGENVLLTRTVETELGSNTITIEDTVENQGFESTPYMILYHINAGFPVLDEESELLLNSEVTPRDEEAAKGLDVAKRGAAPTPGFQEQVHQHDVTPGADGYATAALVNRSFRDGGIGLMVRYRPQELPYFWQWRMVGEATYVMGLEPANCHVMGRGEERRQGRLPFLEAGETCTQRIQLGVLTSSQEIDEVEQTIKGG